MQWHHYIISAIILTQLFFLWVFWKNLKYAISDPWAHRKNFFPKTLLTIPCKGIDRSFDKNIISFLEQDYPDFVINFVVESEDDPAYQKLIAICQEHKPQTKARQVNVLVAGITKHCSQKIHNLLFSYSNCPGDIEVLAFADSDICVHPGWLRDMVCPLNQNKTGATTGYRWFVPEKNNSATIALTIANAKIAQFLGKYPFNQVWGGSMAIKKGDFENYRVPEIWPNVLSDDYSLSYAVKKAHKKVVFVPSGLVGSYEITTWPKLFEFARRQFLITRVFVPHAWWFGLVSGLYSTFVPVGLIVLAVLSVINNWPNFPFYVSAAAVFFLAQLINSVFRVILVKKVFSSDLKKFKFALMADFFISGFCNFLLLAFVLSAAFGREITWRGVKYKLLSPEKTEILTA